MHIGGIHFEIQDLKREIAQKAEQREIYQINSNVDGLERTVRELRSENDGLRFRLEEMDERIRRLEEVSHQPVVFVEDENGFLKVEKQ